MIYATGDAHGSLQRFGSKCFPEQKAMSREACVIICGDYTEKILCRKPSFCPENAII